MGESECFFPSIHINSPLDSMIQKELRQIDKNLKSSV